MYLLSAADILGKVQGLSKSGSFSEDGMLGARPFPISLTLWDMSVFLFSFQQCAY